MLSILTHSFETVSQILSENVVVMLYLINVWTFMYTCIFSFWLKTGTDRYLNLVPDKLLINGYSPSGGTSLLERDAVPSSE